MDGVTWSDPVAEGPGSGPSLVIPFNRPARAKFVRITQTAQVENAPIWAMQELRLFELRPTGR
jgi:hypothetical protein